MSVILQYFFWKLFMRRANPTLKRLKIKTESLLKQHNDSMRIWYDG